MVGPRWVSPGSGHEEVRGLLTSPVPHHHPQSPPPQSSPDPHGEPPQPPCSSGPPWGCPDARWMEGW